MADHFIPYQLRSYLYSLLGYFYTPNSSILTLTVDEKSGMSKNQVFEAAEVYLQTKIGPLNERLLVSKNCRQKTISLAIEKSEVIMDTYENIKLKWRYECTESKDIDHTHHSDKGQFELTFLKKHKALVVEAYLPYVLARAKAINDEQKVLKLSSNQTGSIDLEHPSTFDTLAIDPELKSMIIDDLDRFVSRKGYYKKVGKAWKRGYLLYGPPGTGKSSLIAAMANYLNFDVYDLELSSIYSDQHLKRTLLNTSNRSILVIEDIDCSAKTENRETADSGVKRPNINTISLSGLLNFIDGLWSSVGDERIIIFTTNHKDRLDPALLRPGRMDVLIHMSYCTPSGFKILASNYLGIHKSSPHKLCGEIEGLIESTEVTPAEVAEQLMLLYKGLSISSKERSR